MAAETRISDAVIGGSVNGSGIARNAADRGFPCCSSSWGPRTCSLVGLHQADPRRTAIFGVSRNSKCDAGREIPEALAGGGRDDGGDGEPFEAVVADRDRAPAARRPGLAPHRFQPMRCSSVAKVSTSASGWRSVPSAFIRPPGRMIAPKLRRRPRRAFQPTRSSGLAARAYRGRGFRIVQPIALSASRPRCSATLATPRPAALMAATFPHRPDPAVLGCALQPLAQDRQHLGRQDGRLRAVAALPVAERGRPEPVVAGQKLVDSARHEARQPRRLPDRMPLRQQPDHLVVPRHVASLLPRQPANSSATLRCSTSCTMPAPVVVGQECNSRDSPRESLSREAISRNPHEVLLEVNSSRRQLCWMSEVGSSGSYPAPAANVGNPSMLLKKSLLHRSAGAARIEPEARLRREPGYALPSCGGSGRWRP